MLTAALALAVTPDPNSAWEKTWGSERSMSLVITSVLAWLTSSASQSNYHEGNSDLRTWSVKESTLNVERSSLLNWKSCFISRFDRWIERQRGRILVDNLALGLSGTVLCLAYRTNLDWTVMTVFAAWQFWNCGVVPEWQFWNWNVDTFNRIPILHLLTTAILCIATAARTYLSLSLWHSVKVVKTRSN